MKITIYLLYCQRAIAAIVIVAVETTRKTKSGKDSKRVRLHRLVSSVCNNSMVWGSSAQVWTLLSLTAGDNFIMLTPGKTWFHVFPG